MAPDISVRDWFVPAEFLIPKACLYAVGKKKVEKNHCKTPDDKIVSTN